MRSKGRSPFPKWKGGIHVNAEMEAVRKCGRMRKKPTRWQALHAGMSTRLPWRPVSLQRLMDRRHTWMHSIIQSTGYPFTGSGSKNQWCVAYCQNLPPRQGPWLCRPLRSRY